MKIAIIPARGGSKRVPGKNIMDFFGKPMIGYALDAAKNSGLFDLIHVSTESEEIRATVQKLGYAIEFMRPKELTDDHSGLLPVINGVLDTYKTNGVVFEDICCIMPTAPLLRSEDIVNGFNLYNKHEKKNPLLVVAPYPVPIEWAFYREKDSTLTSAMPDALTKRSQDIKPTFYEAGPFSIFHASHLVGEHPFKTQKFISLLMPKNRAVDIDDHEDLELAKVLFLGNSALENMASSKV